MNALMLVLAIGLLAGCSVASHTRAGSTQADYDRELMACWAEAAEDPPTVPVDQRIGWLAADVLTALAGISIGGFGEGPDWARGERTTACMDRLGWIPIPWQGMEP